MAKCAKYLLERRQRQAYRSAMETPGPDETAVLTNRIRAEYREMPGLRLTAQQAGRLWGLEPAHCQMLLDALVTSGYLRRTAQEAFVLAGGTHEG